MKIVADDGRESDPEPFIIQNEGTSSITTTPTFSPTSSSTSEDDGSFPTLWMLLAFGVLMLSFIRRRKK